MNKIDGLKHEHDYQLSHIDYETPSVQGGTAVLGSVQYAYLVCSCTSVIKRRVETQYTTECEHSWYKCEPETDDIMHCSKCGRHDDQQHQRARR